MSSQGSWFECPICYLSFNSSDRRPMIVCMSQHTACQICIKDMFKGYDIRNDQIKCHFCRHPVKYGDVTLFRHLQQLSQTREQLQKNGSKLRRLQNSLNLNSRQLLNQLRKEKEKNEWLVQLCNRQNRTEGNIINVIQNSMRQLGSQLDSKIRDQRMYYQHISEQQTKEIQNLKQITIQQNMTINNMLNNVMQALTSNSHRPNGQGHVNRHRNINNNFTGYHQETIINNQVMAPKNRPAIMTTYMQPIFKQQRQRCNSKDTSTNRSMSIPRQERPNFTPERLRATTNHQSAHTLCQSFLCYPCENIEDPFDQ